MRAFQVRREDRLETGFSQLDRGDVDVVLLDLNLPDSTGLDTFRAVHRRTMHLPIVILSGQEDVELAVDAVGLGAQDYLTKAEANRSSLARSIRYAIERSRRQRAEQELTAAGEIQRRLFPQSSPEIPGFDIHGRCEPANLAGGDYFDYFPMGRNGLGVVVADVSGHGIGPALIMSETRAVLRTLATTYEDVGRHPHAHQSGARRRSAPQRVRRPAADLSAAASSRSSTMPAPAIPASAGRTGKAATTYPFTRSAAGDRRRPAVRHAGRCQTERTRHAAAVHRWHRRNVQRAGRAVRRTPPDRHRCRLRRSIQSGHDRRDLRPSASFRQRGVLSGRHDGRRPESPPGRGRAEGPSYEARHAHRRRLCLPTKSALHVDGPRTSQRTVLRQGTRHEAHGPLPRSPVCRSSSVFWLSVHRVTAGPFAGRRHGGGGIAFLASLDPAQRAIKPNARSRIRNARIGTSCRWSGPACR